MVVAAFIFGLVIFSVSVFFLLGYIRSHNSIRQNRHSLARQQQLQAKLQADLQTRIEADARKFEEARRALLAHANGESDRADVEHAA
ncbi:MAG: hypothetical protein QOD32_3199 [Pyrinomonadaceae bacterium]|jgi:hypothetical protein|nr:hypothetical protein [Pyrinomonadaceae bacterium]